MHRTRNDWIDEVLSEQAQSREQSFLALRVGALAGNFPDRRPRRTWPNELHGLTQTDEHPTGLWHDSFESTVRDETFQHLARYFAESRAIQVSQPVAATQPDHTHSLVRLGSNLTLLLIAGTQLTYLLTGVMILHPVAAAVVLFVALGFRAMAALMKRELQGTP